MSWAAKRAACNSTSPQFNQSDVGVMPDQFHEERDKRFRFAAPLARHRRQWLKRIAIPDLLAPASRRRGAQQKHLARRRSAQPPSIRFLKQTRRAIESAFPMAHPSTQDESQNVNSGNPQSIHPSMETLIGAPDRDSSGARRALDRRRARHSYGPHRHPLTAYM